jgi:uncharacterized membrane protein YccF (DUF307 family)
MEDSNSETSSQIISLKGCTDLQECSRAAFSIAAYTLLLFGYKALSRTAYSGQEGHSSSCGCCLAGGGWSTIFITAVLLACTIIGIPFAWAHVKVAGLAIAQLRRGETSKKRGRRTATATAAEFCKTRQLPIKFANDVKSLAGNYVAGARRTEGQCRHWRGPHHETAGGRGSTADLSIATRNPTETSVYSPFLRVGIVPGRISRNSTGRIGRNSTGRRRLPAGRGPPIGTAGGGVGPA